LRRKDYSASRFTLTFIGYGDESDTAVIELTHNWDTGSYEPGNGFGHVAIAVDDIIQVCEKIRASGDVISREPSLMKHGSSVIAFVKEPVRYAIELIETTT
jgi:lactoylglutathione lyase